MSITSNTSMIESNNSIIQAIKTKLQNYTPGSGGESSSNIAKIFNSEEAMNENFKPTEKDQLAVLYGRTEYTPITSSSRFQILYFPSTVTLPSAFTSDAYSSLYSNMGGAQIMMSDSYFELSAYGEIFINISYTSSDGITYTRQDTMGEIVDLGAEHYFYMEEEWNDAFGYFMQTALKCFDGLYVSDEVKDEDCCEFITNVQADGSYEKIKVNISKLKPLIVQIKNELSTAGYTPLTCFVRRVDDDNFVCYYKVPTSADKQIRYIGLKVMSDGSVHYTPEPGGLTNYTTSTWTLYKREINCVNGTITSSTIPSSELSTVSWGSYTRPYTTATIEDGAAFVGMNFSNASVSGVGVEYANYDDYTHVSLQNTTKFIIKKAETQLDAIATDLANGKTAYGKDGIITGSAT